MYVSQLNKVKLTARKIMWRGTGILKSNAQLLTILVIKNKTTRIK